MAQKPRVLIIEREGRSDPQLREGLTENFEVVTAQTMARAMAWLRQHEFAGVVVDAQQLASVRWVGMMIQSDEILNAISDGVAVVDPSLKILWANPEFRELLAPGVEPVDMSFYRVLNHPEILEPDVSPFELALDKREPTTALVRIEPTRFLRLSVTPVLEPTGRACQLIALTRDVTAEELQKQKIDAIHKAGEELADLTPEELAELGVDERIDLLKLNIVRHMKDLLGLDFIEIRLLDRTNSRLVPLLAEGMTHLAASRELYARREGNGVTGFVAATGKSYLCRDTSSDPLYLEGASGARSSLTVPLLFHGTVIGTLNVENMQPNAFDDRDRQFLEIYGRSVAAALNTLELLQAEKHVAATAYYEAVSGELALPIDDILNDASIVLDRYAGHDEDIIDRLRHLLVRARDIRKLIRNVGSTIVPDTPKGPAKAPQPLAGVRLLVADAEEAIRKAAHTVLGQQGAIVETARDGLEAVTLARQSPYAAALTDIRLPDLNGYQVFKRLREQQPGLPIILMTGFGYDPTHSIVNARQEGLQTVLYKPFRADRLLEAVHQALRFGPGDARVPSRGDGSEKSGGAQAIARTSDPLPPPPADPCPPPLA
jgi:DNA-binding response OmpR family regulator/GAF domain-containing protein